MDGVTHIRVCGMSGGNGTCGRSGSGRADMWGYGWDAEHPLDDVGTTGRPLGFSWTVFIGLDETSKMAM